jgi:hypothetical protein
MFLVIPPNACWQPTEESRVLVTAAERAIARAQIPQKAAAAAQGLTESQWNRQLKGRDGAHVSMFRFGLLVLEYPKVLLYLVDELADLVDAKVLTRGEMRDLIDQAQVLILKMGKRRKPMARADLPGAVIKPDRRRA